MAKAEIRLTQTPTQTQTRTPPRSRVGARTLRPSAAADAELRWFFEEAEIATGQPSNFQALLAGASVTSLEAVERRAEAVHAARKIADRLERLSSTDALLLAGLYTERPWSRAATRAFPGGLAGAACASLPMLDAFARAAARGETRATDVARFVEEIARTVTVRHGTHLRETSDLPCDRVHGTSTAIEVMVDGDGGAVEKKRADGGGIRLARRAVGFLPPMVVERAWTW